MTLAYQHGKHRLSSHASEHIMISGCPGVSPFVSVIIYPGVYLESSVAFAVSSLISTYHDNTACAAGQNASLPELAHFNLACFRADWHAPRVQVRSVTLHAPYTTFALAKEIVDVLGSLADLKSLRLSHFDCSSYAQLQDVVAACPRLERLYLDHVHLLPLSAGIYLYVSAQPSPCPPS